MCSRALLNLASNEVHAETQGHSHAGACADASRHQSPWSKILAFAGLVEGLLHLHELQNSMDCPAELNIAGHDKIQRPSCVSVDWTTL